MFEQSPSSSDARLYQPFTEKGNFLMGG